MMRRDNINQRVVCEATMVFYYYEAAPERNYNEIQVAVLAR